MMEFNSVLNANNVNNVVGGGGGGNVPAFLTKLWTLVEDPQTDQLICWSPNGTSFHVFDQGQFSKEVLPKFFKHNNMASFVRQLNMYGFRKVVHIEQGGLVKPERDDTEFQHPYFIRGQEHLLENIKRKVTNVSAVKQEDLRITTEDVTKILTDVQHMKGKQENIDAKISTMKHENEALWREVASLRQKHAQQQKVVSKLIQFLVSLVQSNRVMGMKRKIPLMLSDSSSTHSLPKYSRQFSLEHLQSSPALTTSSLLPADSPLTSGPIISDITDQAPPSPTPIPADWTEAGASPLVLVKEEAVEDGTATPVDSSLSPTTFINSILQDEPTHNQRTVNPLPDPVTATSSLVTSDRAPSPAPSPAKRNQKCLSVSCIDKSELNDHLENIDGGLESLQTILNSQNISFDSTPLFDFFSSSVSSGDFDLDSLDSLLSPLTPKADDRTGKQLVQYMATPLLTTEQMGGEEAELPSLLELEGEESYFSPDATLSLLGTPIFSHESNEQEDALEAD